MLNTFVITQQLLLIFSWAKMEIINITNMSPGLNVDFIFFTPWSEQMRPKLEPAQVLRLNAATGRQRRSRHIMLGPHGVPSSTYPRSDPSSSRAWPPLTETFRHLRITGHICDSRTVGWGWGWRGCFTCSPGTCSDGTG